MAGSAAGLPVHPAALPGGMGQATRAQLQLELQHLDEPLVAVALRRIEACTNQKTEMEAVNASIYDDGDRADGVCSDGDYGISREPDASPPTASHPVKKWTVSQTARPSQVKGGASKATFDECAKRALDLSLSPGQADRREYIRGCMGGSPSACEMLH
jgi:hypothetical protein